MAVDGFWLAHEVESGKPILGPTHAGLGLGLASTRLAELLLSGHIALNDDFIVAMARQPPPNALARQLFSLVLGEPEPLPLRTWLSFLAKTARGDLGIHLERYGQARALPSRFRRTARWLPTDIRDAMQPSIRLRVLLRDGGARSPYDPVLASIADASGLLAGVLGPDEKTEARQVIPAIVGGLHPVLRALVNHTRAALSATVLSGRG